MLIRAFLLWSFICSSFAIGFQSSLSESQCARFYNEYQLISKKMNDSSGEASKSLGNRYGRLQDRLEAFCQHTEYTATPQQSEDTPVSQKNSKAIVLYSDESKQADWESFYTPPSYCLTESLSSVNKLRCKNELERFKEIFDQQWEQKNQKVSELDNTNLEEANSQVQDETNNEQSEEANFVSNKSINQKKQPTHSTNNENTDLAVKTKTTGLDTLFVYIEDYLLALIILLIILVVIKLALPSLKRLFTKHFSYVAVNKYLMKHLSVNEYSLYSRISLPISGGMADIDELILSPFGIFIIICQPQTGRIYADTTSEVWTEQVGKKRNNFPSPSRQLPIKIAGVKQLLGIDDNVQGIIVFDQEVDFRTNMPKDVLQTGQLLAKIQHFEEKVFTPEQISHFVLLLSEYKPSNPFKELMGKIGSKQKMDSEWGG